MKAQIIQIGNSQGIRIPKALLEESGIRGEVELELSPDGILIRNLQKPRSNWDQIFRDLAESNEEDSIESTVPTEFEKAEWQW